ncbi:hypothetical protein ES708_26272 [subsurface metagenome]
MLSSKPTLAWPPITIDKLTIGNSCLPIAHTVNVEFFGILFIINTKSRGVAAIPPMTPNTKLKCIGSLIYPLLFSRNAMSIMPLSKHSSSGLIPREFIS